MPDTTDLLNRLYAFCWHITDADNSTEEQKRIAKELAEAIGQHTDQTNPD